MDKTQNPNAVMVIIPLIAEAAGESTTGCISRATAIAKMMIAEQANKIVRISWRSKLPDGIRGNTLMAHSLCPSYASAFTKLSQIVHFRSPVDIFKVTPDADCNFSRVPPITSTKLRFVLNRVFESCGLISWK
jgi:hypothetical protein